MKKRIFGRQLSQNTKSRKALFRSLVKALVTYGKIKTTKAKAKAVQPLVDKIINLAKKKDLSSKRRVYAILGNDRKITDQIFALVETNFSSRTSGYTKITKLPLRRGDSSPVVYLQWTEEIAVSNKKEEKSDKSKKESKSGKLLNRKPATQRTQRSPLRALKKKGSAESK